MQTFTKQIQTEQDLRNTFIMLSNAAVTTVRIFLITFLYESISVSENFLSLLLH